MSLRHSPTLNPKRATMEIQAQAMIFHQWKSIYIYTRLYVYIHTYICILHACFSHVRIYIYIFIYLFFFSRNICWCLESPGLGKWISINVYCFLSRERTNVLPVESFSTRKDEHVWHAGIAVPGFSWRGPQLEIFSTALHWWLFVVSLCRLVSNNASREIEKGFGDMALIYIYMLNLQPISTIIHPCPLFNISLFNDYHPSDVAML